MPIFASQMERIAPMYYKTFNLSKYCIMAKFLYTIVNYARVIIEREGELPISVKSYIEHKRFYEVSQIEFIQSIADLANWHCKLSWYYVSELLDATASPCFASTGETADKAQQLLFHIIPISYTSHLKNPLHSDDARRIINKYKTNHSL